MTVIHLYNSFGPVILKEFEIIGPPKQSTFIDLCSTSGVVHEGRTVEELLEEGYVGVYLPLDKYGAKK